MDFLDGSGLWLGGDTDAGSGGGADGITDVFRVTLVSTCTCLAGLLFVVLA